MSESASEGDEIVTWRFIITMPLIPNFKTSVAGYCNHPSNRITGFIRWQSMDTIYAIKLDCLCQGHASIMNGMSSQLQHLAYEIWSSRTGGLTLRPKIVVAEQRFETRKKYTSFIIGSTPKKVMEVWHKERKKLASNPQKVASTSVALKSRSLDSGAPVSAGASNLDSLRGIHGSVHNADSLVGLGQDDTDRQSVSSLDRKTEVVHALWVHEMKYSMSMKERRPPQLIWRDNSHSSRCHVCNSSFSQIFKRIHHCRRCGELVCGACSPGTGPGVMMVNMPSNVLKLIAQGTPQRLCLPCAEGITKQSQADKR